MAWGKPTYPKAPVTQSTTAAEYKPTVPTNIGSAGAALGVGAGVVKPIANNPPVSGASIGIGGGIAQGAAPAPAPSYPSGGGGGGSAFGAGTGMTADDWMALIAAQNQPAVDRSAEGSIGGAATAGGLDVYGRSGPGDGGDPFAGLNGQLPAMPPGEGSSIYTDPGFLSLIAGMEAELAGNESGMRRAQDEARRRFTTDLPMFERNWDQNRGRLKNAFEARGLLKSGGTEDALSRSLQSQGEERARGEANVADTVANLENQIAQARAAFNRNKGQAAIQYAGQQPVT